MSVFVGLDCGGSSCRVLAINEQGEVLHQGQSGAANLASTPEGRMRRNLTAAARGCPPADFVCGCFAGLISEPLRQRGISILADIFGTKPKFRAEPDYSAALYSSDSADLCVISGTGSLVCSRSGGEIVKSGGRGYIYGDEGSGYWIGKQAVQHYLDRAEPPTDTLIKGLVDVFGSSDDIEIIAGTYRAPTPATVLAKLAKTVGSSALQKEPYAVRIVDESMRSLAVVVRRHIDRYHASADQLSLALAGGVWKAGSPFRESFEGYLNEFYPHIQIEMHRLTRPPIYGAVELARAIQ